VLEELKPDVKDTCELASLHSVSKGLLGECGMRGGYLYLHQFNPEVYQELVKLKSINLCSNSLGQIMVDCMVNPPLEGVSKATKDKFEAEYKGLLESLKYRAKIVTKYLNSMTNVKCQEVEGSMYAFPSITFSKKAQEAAKKEGKAADLFYCLDVLKNTGIALVPGSGFRQKPGTHHFRITTLILPESHLENKLKALKEFNEKFHAKYAD
jgi:aspartate/methionine/tyrosine aminotransferase